METPKGPLGDPYIETLHMMGHDGYEEVLEDVVVLLYMVYLP